MSEPTLSGMVPAMRGGSGKRRAGFQAVAGRKPGAAPAKLTGMDGKELAQAPKPAPKLKDVAKRAMQMRSSEMDSRLIRRLNLTVSDLRAQMAQMSREMELMRRQEVAWRKEKDSMQAMNSRLQDKVTTLQAQLDTLLASDETKSLRAAGSGSNSKAQIMTPSGVVTIGKSSSFLLPNAPDWRIGSNDDGNLLLTPAGAIQLSPSDMAEMSSSSSTNPLRWSVHQEGDKIMLTAREALPDLPDAEGETAAQQAHSAQIEKNLRAFRSIVLMVTKAGLVVTPSGVADIKSQIQERRDDAPRKPSQQQTDRPKSAGGTVLPIVTPAGTI